MHQVAAAELASSEDLADEFSGHVCVSYITLTASMLTVPPSFPLSKMISPKFGL